MAKPTTSSLQFHAKLHSSTVNLFDQNTTAVFSSGADDPFIMSDRPVKPDEELHLRICRGSCSQLSFRFAFTELDPKLCATMNVTAATSAVSHQLIITSHMAFVCIRYDAQNNIYVTETGGSEELVGTVASNKELWAVFYLTDLRVGFATPSISIIKTTTYSGSSSTKRQVKPTLTRYSGGFHQKHGSNIRLIQNCIASCFDDDNSQGFVLSQDPIKSNEMISVKLTSCDECFSFGFTSIDPERVEDSKSFDGDDSTWISGTVKIGKTSETLAFYYNEQADVTAVLGEKSTKYMQRRIDVEKPLWAVMCLRRIGASVALETTMQWRPALGKLRQIREKIEQVKALQKKKALERTLEEQTKPETSHKQLENAMKDLRVAVVKPQHKPISKQKALQVSSKKEQKQNRYSHFHPLKTVPLRLPSAIWYFSQNPAREGKRVVINFETLVPRSTSSQFIFGLCHLHPRQRTKPRNIPSVQRLLDNCAAGWMFVYYLPVQETMTDLKMWVHLTSNGELHFQRDDEEVQSMSMKIWAGNTVWWFLRLQDLQDQFTFWEQD